jgi:hypothetical protein
VDYHLVRPQGAGAKDLEQKQQEFSVWYVFVFLLIRREELCDYLSGAPVAVGPVSEEK